MRIGSVPAARNLPPDELVVGLNPTVCAEDDELESTGSDLARVGDHLPTERDDIREPRAGVLWPE